MDQTASRPVFSNIPIADQIKGLLEPYSKGPMHQVRRQGGTPMKKSNRKACIRYALKRKLSDTMLLGVLHDRVTKRQLYGFHPTKSDHKRRSRSRAAYLKAKRT